MGDPKPLLPLSRTAEVMTDDGDLWVMPRYEKLHLLNILALQRRLSALEDGLTATLDCEAHRSRGQECSPSCLPPTDLLPELQSTLKAYDEAIIALAAIKKSENPAAHVLKGLKAEGRSMWGSSLTQMLEKPPMSGKAVRGDETSHLLSIATGSRSWFQGYIESHHRLGRVFQKQFEPGRSENFIYYEASSVKSAEFGIVAVCLCLVQLLPVMALTLVRGRAARLAIIIGLIVLVSLLNSLFAHTVQATNFGAVAAYSAIVVAFLSNLFTYSAIIKYALEAEELYKKDTPRSRTSTCVEDALYLVIEEEPAVLV